MKATRLSETAFREQFLPEVTVDVVLLSIAQNGSLCTVVAQRNDDLFRGAWALPGVFVGRDETLESAAARALRAKAGISNVFLEQLYTFGDVGRDPRGRILSVAYYALVPEGRFVTATARAVEARIAYLDIPWADKGGDEVRAVDDAGEQLNLAFDHANIIGMAVQRIRGKLNYAPIGFELLPDKFTLFDLQMIHEAVLGRKVNKDSFRRRMLASGLIEDTGEVRGGTSYRPATLYRFKNTGVQHG